jgi:hypothetical protein
VAVIFVMDFVELLKTWVLTKSRVQNDFHLFIYHTLTQIIIWIDIRVLFLFRSVPTWSELTRSRIEMLSTSKTSLLLLFSLLRMLIDVEIFLLCILYASIAGQSHTTFVCTYGTM